MTTINKFLRNYTIKLTEVPAYVEFNNDWTIVLDKEICRLILESDDPRLNPEMKDHFRKTYDLIDPLTNKLKVLYRPRHGVGRRYAEEPSEEFYTYQGQQRRNENYGKYWGSLTIHSKYIKNTIFHYLGWRDYDQRKGHPTILHEVAKRNGVRLGAYEDYIKEGGFEAVCAEMIEWYSVEGETPLEEGDIKDLFNKTIYGGGHPKWCDYITHENLSAKDRAKLIRKGKQPKEMRHKNEPHPFYARFLKDTKLITQLVWENNAELRAKVCVGMADDSDQPFSHIRNTLMSQFCGIIENELTFRAYKYRVENGLCPAKGADWGYDGYTTPPPHPHTDHEFHLNAMNDYVREKTGFSGVVFVEKQFKPSTILQSVIDARRELVVAQPAVGNLVVLGEAVVAPPEPSNDDEAYLVWKENFEKEWCKIKNTASFLRVCKKADGTFEKYITHSEKQLKTAYGHECYDKTTDGKTKKVKCINEWLEDPNMLCYEDADMFPPPLVCPPTIFNLWRPFPFANNWDYENPETAYEFDAEGVQMFCDHLKMLCNHEEEVYNYVSCWFAHAIQKPAEKSTQIIMISEEGAGKNMLLETFSCLLGEGKVLTTSTPEREVWGSFNSLMINAFLVNLNEVDKRNAYNADGKIKELITDGKLCVNQKGKDQFVIRSVHRFFTTTNNTDPNKTHDKDRRNMIIRCSDEKIGDYAYFKALGERMKDQRTLRSIYCCLMRTDLTEWDFRRIPRTEYHNTIIEGNRPPLEIFLENFTINNRDKESVDLYGKEILALFRKWKEESGYSFDDKISEGTLVKRLLLELKLPKDTIVKLARGAKGIKRTYDIAKLRQRFNIPAGPVGQPYIPLAGGGIVANEIIVEEDEADDGVETENEDN
jgi:hypothetical protein